MSKAVIKRLESPLFYAPCHFIYGKEHDYCSSTAYEKEYFLFTAIKEYYTI